MFIWTMPRPDHRNGHRSTRMGRPWASEAMWMRSRSNVEFVAHSAKLLNCRLRGTRRRRLPMRRSKWICRAWPTRLPCMRRICTPKTPSLYLTAQRILRMYGAPFTGRGLRFLDGRNACAWMRAVELSSSARDRVRTLGSMGDAVELPGEFITAR